MTQGMQRSADTGFATALQSAVERMQETSEADIIALYPYDDESDSFYAPVAVGLLESDLVHSLPDFAGQLQRFRSDQAEGKTPDDLSPRSYGTSAWLLTTRRPLISTDAMAEAESSFVRRHKIESIVALPLIVGNRIVGLLYLNYVQHKDKRTRIDVSSAIYLERIGEAAEDIAVTIDSSRRAEEADILRSISTLVSDFSALPVGPEHEGASTLRLETALHRVLSAAHLDAAALYVPVQGRNRLTLLAAQGFQAADVEMLPLVGPDDLIRDETLIASLANGNLHALTALAPRGQGHHGILVLADRDQFVLNRRLPMDYSLLQTATDLLGAMLYTGRLAEALEDTNRTLGAVTRLSTRLLQPGATQDETLRTAVAALTDPELPELDFEIADIFLLETASDGGLIVTASAGATASPDIASMPDEGLPSPTSRRVPTWAAPGVRRLDPQDVLAYAATRRRAIVVAAREAQEHDDFVSGYPEDGLERMAVPVVRDDGSNEGSVHAARLREAADRAPMRSENDEGTLYRQTTEITLNAAMFDEYKHAALVRVFVPFGSDGNGRATGVLEAGFHVSRSQSIGRVQIEALRACAATVAVAVETARLYEDVTLRARQLEIVTEVSRAIATSIDLEQTLRLIARNMVRAVDASVCLIALLDEDGSAWYGAAASDQDELWRHRRVERPEQSIVFEAADHNHPVVVEDAMNNHLVSPYMARLLGLRSLIALPLQAGDGDAFGAVLLGQRDRQRLFNAGEIERLSGLASQAAMAIRNARVHAREEEEHHIQKDVVLIGFGQWGQKAYKHLVLLKSFFNFRTHVVEADLPGRRQVLEAAEETVLANGDLFYWDSPSSPAHEALTLELEPSCYVITYIATPAETHLPVLKMYYDLSNVVLIEKPLGAPPEEYRIFLDSTDGSVQIVAADHYWFKTEVRLLENLLTEERNLRAFLDEIEEVEIEILEEQEPGGSGAQIGMIADLIPHAFAVLSLLTPLDHLKLDPHRPLQVGRYQPLRSEHETYARLLGSFDHRGRRVRVTIDVGKGVSNAKFIKLSGERRMGGRRSFYKFDFTKGEAIDGTQSALRAATRPIRQPGVPDNAHLSMLRHVVEKRHPAVGILSIREALRANARIQQIEQTAGELITSGNWMPYEHGQRPAFPPRDPLQMMEMPDMSVHATGD